MNRFFQDLSDKRNTLVHHLTTVNHFLEPYHSGKDFLVVFSNFIFSCLLLLSNFLYFFVALFQERRLYIDFFQNLFIDLGLIFLSCLIFITKLISCIGEALPDDKPRKNKLDIVIEENNAKIKEIVSFHENAILETDAIDLKCIEFRELFKTYNCKLQEYANLCESVIAEFPVNEAPVEECSSFSESLDKNSNEKYFILSRIDNLQKRYEQLLEKYPDPSKLKTKRPRTLSEHQLRQTQLIDFDRENKENHAMVVNVGAELLEAIDIATRIIYQEIENYAIKARNLESLRMNRKSYS